MYLHVRDIGPGVDPWVMKSRALEHAGYLPGDILIVDLNAKPQDGDAVCAQIYDRNGKTETAFRIYEYPFLIAASADPDLRRPVLVDNERASIRGVVMASIRPASRSDLPPIRLTLAVAVWSLAAAGASHRSKLKTAACG